MSDGNNSRTSITIKRDGVLVNLPGSGVGQVTCAALSNRHFHHSIALAIQLPALEGMTRLGGVVQREGLGLDGVSRGISRSSRTAIHRVHNIIYSRCPCGGICQVACAALSDSNCHHSLAHTIQLPACEVITCLRRVVQREGLSLDGISSRVRCSTTVQRVGQVVGDRSEACHYRLVC